jgi:AraC-like DNA-binding protein
MCAKFIENVYIIAMRTITFDDLSKLSVFTDFYSLANNLFGVSIALVRPDRDQQILLGARERLNPFCLGLQFDLSVRKRCMHCNIRHQLKAKRLKRSLRYYCHTGMTEFVIPIIVDDEIVAFLRCGQVLDKKPSIADWQKVHGKLKGKLLDFTALRKNYLSTRVIPVDAQTHLIKLLELFANHIAYAGSQLLLAEKFRSSQLSSLAEKYIAANATKHITLDDVARETYSSKRNLIRVVKAQTGVTVRETINKVRIERAREMMKDSSKKISILSIDCGYNSVQQFIRVFKRLTGTTPRRWRVQWQNSHAPAVR